ncbi:MAG: CehA/McbA family metallohydrolase [Acidobacteria bacterium]|nr:CehA/McbA family metallohydrolase [Acidobacteriota bacterium]
MSSFVLTRTKMAVVFLAALGAAQWRAGTEVVAPEEVELGRYDVARGVLRELLDKSGELLGAAEKQSVRDTLAQLNQAFAREGGTRAVLINSHSPISRAVYLFERNSNVERIWAGGAEVAGAVIERSWPSSDGLLLVRIGMEGMDGDNAPQFVYRELDLHSPVPQIKLDRARSSYAVIWVKNARPGRNRVVAPVLSGGKEVARLDLAVNVPEPGRLRVAIVYAGKPTPAVVGLYAADHRLVVPAGAISFDNAGFTYRAGQVRPYYSMHCWPGAQNERQVFFVDGGFALSVPAGRYKLIVGKGFEYTPVTTEIDIGPGGEVEQKIDLKRWVDMPARGWHSGDGHVHYARATEAANGPLLTWAQAEDVHMINVVRMGDALKTYFEQYSFGQAGRKLLAGFALVPGQEDPRTDNIGHTLHMNIQAPIRFPDGYYLYDKVFDEVHRQGGLSGYAHAYQPPRFSFFVRQNMTLNIPRNKVDFAEISEFGDIDTDVYYEFLNLGFKLTASAGSDVPWGQSIGTSRVYAYTGRAFDPDDWFAAVKAGRTFVSTGPMLELTVNGERPGAELRLKAGETVRIEATAAGLHAAPEYLEVIDQGEVLKASPRTGKSLAVSATLKVKHSTWIAARCAGAHTSPIYIRVGDQPTWKHAAVPELIRTRMRQLDDMEELTSKGVGTGGEGNWNNPEGFRRQAPELLERIRISRGIYRQMLEQAAAARGTP